MTSVNHTDTWSADRLSVRFAVFALLFGLFYIIDGYDLLYAFREREQDLSMGSAASVQAGGSAARRLAFILLAGYGLVGVLWPRVTDRALHGALGAVLLIALVYTALSPLWAADLGLAVRRTGAFMLFLIGAAGVAYRWPLVGVIQFACLVPAAIVGTGLAIELAAGRFAPLSEGYRFYGIAHANQNGGLLGVMILAALCIARLRSDWRRVLLILAMVGFAVLLATRSRTALFTLVAGFGVWWLNCDRTAAARKLGVLLLAGTIVTPLAFLLFGGDIVEAARSAVLLGRGEDTSPETLTGRVPLWGHLIEVYASDRPFLGYGYGAFWTAERLLDVSEYFAWPIYYSHSGYIEVLLDLGLVGLVLFVAIVFLALWRALALYRASDDPHWLFVASILVWHNLSSISRAVAPYPELLTFLVLVLVIKTAMTPVPEPASKHAGTSTSP